MAADLLAVGKSGLFAAKKSLETTAHNISNANTEGYSRQEVLQHTNRPIGEGNVVHGTGVTISKIRRVHDKQVEDRVRDHTTDKGFHAAKEEKLAQVESIFNEVDTDGLNLLLNKFFNTFRNLASQPENETMRSIVRENSKLLIQDFRRINGLLKDVSNQVEHNVSTHVKEINHYLHTVSKLNKKIVELETAHGETGDLRDQRDQIVRNLSEMFALSSYEDERGNYNIHVKGIGSLVTGDIVQELVARPVHQSLSSNGEEGSIELYLKNKPSTPITTNLKKGRLASLFTTRNSDIKSLKKQVDDIAYHFSRSVNAIHRRGFTNEPMKIDKEGKPVFETAKKQFTGINFFKNLESSKDASRNIELSDKVLEDLSNITTALAPNSPGDNRVAIAISKLQHEKMIDNGNRTLEEKYLMAIGEIGISTSKAQIENQQVDAILAQTKAIKERISGVSIDEETANMVKYQQAYDASAKVMKAADETMNSVLQLL